MEGYPNVLIHPPPSQPDTARGDPEFRGVNVGGVGGWFTPPEK